MTPEQKRLYWRSRFGCASGVRTQNYVCSKCQFNGKYTSTPICPHCHIDMEYAGERRELLPKRKRLKSKKRFRKHKGHHRWLSWKRNGTDYRYNTPER